MMINVTRNNRETKRKSNGSEKVKSNVPITRLSLQRERIGVCAKRQRMRGETVKRGLLVFLFLRED